jgi:hypothetical protein
MNLPARLITTLTTEEELEAIMNDAAVIQGGDAAVGAATVEPTVIQANVEKRKKKDMRPNEVTNEPTEHVVAESPQNESAPEQIALKQTKNREARQKRLDGATLCQRVQLSHQYSQSIPPVNMSCM